MNKLYLKSSYRETLLLFKIQLMNQYRLNDLIKGRASGNSTKKSLAILIRLIVVLVLGGQSFSLAIGLGFIGLSALIPAYAVTATGIATLIFTMLKTNGFLFGYRDYDMLMSLPVSTKSLIGSRFLTVYFTNMLFTFMIMIPMGIGYALWMKPGILFYLYWLIGMFTAPLIPTTIAVTLGALIMAIASRFKYARILSTLLTLLLIIGTLVLSMSGGAIGQEMNVTENITRLGEIIHNEISRRYPPAGLFDRIFAKNSLASLLLFVGLSFLIYYVFVTLLSLKYKSINSNINGRIKRSDYRLTELKTASPLKALYRKEIKRFFSSTAYVTNAGVGVIMTLIFSVGMAVLGPNSMGESLGIPGFTAVLHRILPFLLPTLLSMTCTSCTSLSLEGKNLWILQSCPIPLKTVFDSKILTNLTLTLTASLFSSLILTIRLQPELVTALLMFAIPVTGSFFSAVFGMYINIKFPRYDWESEIIVIKQSLSTMCGMLGGTVIMMIAMGITFLPLGIDYRAISSIIAVIMWIFCFFMYRSIGKCRLLVS